MIRGDDWATIGGVRSIGADRRSSQPGFGSANRVDLPPQAQYPGTIGVARMGSGCQRTLHDRTIRGRGPRHNPWWLAAVPKDFGQPGAPTHGAWPC
jgi:hypothetical protein